LTNETAPNMGFGVIGAGRCNINFSNMASSVRAGRFSIWLLVVIFNFGFLIGLQFRADAFQIPQQRQALIVTCYYKATPYNLQWDYLTKYLEELKR
jgi:hypothetical protein